MQVYNTEQAFFACLMAICALAAARVRDGAVTDLAPNISSLLIDVRSEIYINAAEAAFPPKLVDARGFDYLRASALLTVVAMQNEQHSLVQQHLGNYFTLVALEGMHDEARWPHNIKGIERQERRRLVSVFGIYEYLY